MAEQEFSEFVERKTARAESDEAIDWARTRKDWQRDLENLYGRMEQYLKPYTEERKIEIDRTTVQLREDHLGTYTVPQLTIKIGRDKVVARPIGTLLIGARGRVDLSGPRKTLKVVLLAKGGPMLTSEIDDGGVVTRSGSSMVRGDVKEAGWYIETTPPDSIVVAFTEDSFRDAIMDVAGG